MKTLLIGEYREGKLLDTTYELCGFAAQLGGEIAMLLVGSEGQLPDFGGTLYLADVAACGEYNPDLHKKLILDTVARENPDYVVFVHSSYGWDLAPRVAAGLKAAQVSEIVALADGGFEVACCNAKMAPDARKRSGRRRARYGGGQLRGNSRPGPSSHRPHGGFRGSRRPTHGPAL